MHINPGYISLACLMSECCEKALVLLSQLCMLEDSKISGEGFVILWHSELQPLLGVEYALIDWKSSDAIFLPQKPVRPWWYRPYTIGTGPDHSVAAKLGTVATFDLSYG